tara:strand:+ start:342 stop:737 length:396 start_codon:yes stop_codon:yes gene_type:complete
MKDINILLSQNPDFTFVKVEFGPSSAKLYTYKTLIPDLVKGDLVIVESPNEGFKVVTIKAVCNPAEINLDVPYDYKWVAQKLDLTDYEGFKSIEKLMRKELNKAKSAKLVTDLQQTIGAEAIANLKAITRF